MPPLTEFSRPELKLAGMRIDAELFSASKSSYYLDISIVSSDQVVPADEVHTIKIHGYPSGSWINLVGWSPDSKKIVFSTRSPGGPDDPPRLPLDLWVADAGTGEARQLIGHHQRLNTIFEDYHFINDRQIVACMVPRSYEASGGSEKAPVKPLVLEGPRIEDNSHEVKTSQSRTYPDLLKDAHDVALFKFFGSSEIAIVDVTDGATKIISDTPHVYTDVSSSPDGEFLLVTWLDEPFATTVPCGRFPKVTQLWDKNGKVLRTMANLPLAEDIPILFNSVRKGPRSITWRSDKASEIYWIEAQDGGDASVAASPRDIVYTLPASSKTVAEDPPRFLAQTDLRCGGVAWCNDDLALLYESWWKTRRSVVSMIAPGNPQKGSSVLFDRNYEDSYSDPGSPLTRRSRWGTGILALVDGERKLLMQGMGASPEGNRPFLDVLPLDQPESKVRIWQSRTDASENLGGIFLSAEEDEAQPPITLNGLKMLLSRETGKEPPQSYLVTFAQDASAPSSAVTTLEKTLTQYPHPYPQLMDMKREIIRYKRDDGVTLTATLYLPPGYNKERDGPLPCLLWAYPREFKSKEAAGQNTRSPHQFAYIGSSSPTLWVARGYAVLDGPTLPIVAEGEEEPNDSFIQQLVAGAKAVIDYCSERGEVDAKRVTVAGHSYGAFMAANLLAHAPDLFACGVARTGAYNRTLTPFGFQSEERTIWQVPAIYNAMSPFYSADKIKTPLLLIHGAEDDNPGTFPLQSERMYQALKGHGATTRLVLLPHEAHSYRARENVLHALFEQDQWMERFAGFSRIKAE